MVRFCIHFRIKWQKTLLRAPAAALVPKWEIMVLLSVAVGTLQEGVQNCLTPLGTLFPMKASGTCASKSPLVTVSLSSVEVQG